MHRLIALAGVPPGRAPALAQLEALLARSLELPLPPPDELDLHTPAERLLGQGRLPLAAWRVQQPGAWVFVSPVHLQIEVNQVLALPQAALEVDAQESRALFDAIAPLFPSDEGWQRLWMDPLTWALAHPQLEGLDLASLGRVTNRPLTPWLPHDRNVRRWTNEVQMLWHGHAVNTARATQRRIAINSLWWWGAGVASGSQPAIEQDNRLTLAKDATEWANSLQSVMDDLPQAARGWTLSLAGERRACSFAVGAKPFWQRWRKVGPKAVDLLGSL
jgi:hypothetical protein